jgi:hypothetical protein
VAVEVFRALRDDVGGVNWAALPLFVTLYGVDDVELLIERLVVLKTHRPEE